MTAVKNVAVVGAGAAGLAAAILLREADVTVDVYEAKPELSALGSGITLQGNALRVLDRLGVWEEVKALGYPFEGLNLRAPGRTPRSSRRWMRSRPVAPTTRPAWACTAPTWPRCS